MTNVYFFSRHEAQPQMVADLGGTITQQFRGTIFGIKSVGDGIEFQEIPLGETEPVAHTIPSESIVVAVAPLALQEAWLRSRVSVFLSPQNKRETTESGEIVFNYAGLLQVLKIEVVTQQWVGAAVSLEDKHAERSAL